MKNFLFSGSVKYAAKLFLFISWIYGCDKFFFDIKKSWY